MDECTKRGGSCSVVLSWSGTGCGAYRTVKGEVGTAYGWGIASTQIDADAIATREALKRSNGKPVENYVYSCNSANSGVFEVIKNDSQETSKNKLVGLKDSSDNVFDYEGETLNNLPNGSGIAMPNCRKYVGEFVNGKPSGSGKCYDSSGKIIYEGSFSNGEPSGNQVNKGASEK